MVNIDACEAALEKADKNVQKLLEKKVAKGKLTEEQKDEILGRLTYSGNMEDVKDAMIIVEAVPAKIELKKEIFAKLE